MTSRNLNYISLGMSARLLSSVIVSFALFASAAGAQTDSCAKHGKSVRGCTFCREGNVKVGENVAISFPWANSSREDIVIRKEPSAKLEVLAGQSAAQIGTSSDFAGRVADSVTWFGGENGSSVFLVFMGSQAPFVEMQGGFSLTKTLPDFKMDEPAVVLKLTVETADYAFDTRQTGTFKPTTQCAVFYRVP